MLPFHALLDSAPVPPQSDFSLYTSRACSYGAAYLAIFPLYSFYFFLYLYLWFFSVCGVDWEWIGEQGLGILPRILLFTHYIVWLTSD